MSGRHGGILCVGNAVVDLTAQTLERYPGRGKAVIVPRIGMYTGGCAVNTAIDLAILGTRIGIAAAVGRDDLGRFLLGKLKAAGVDVSGASISRSLPTSTTFVMVWPDGERSFVHATGANDMVTDKSVPSSLIRRYEGLHLSAYFIMPGLDGAPAVRLLKRASDLGRKTSLDTCWDPQGRWKMVLGALPHVDVFMPSLNEARRVFGTSSPRGIARRALAEGVREAVIVKLGAKGCYALTRRGNEYRVPAFRVRAVDTTGAGDAFNAGFLSGRERALDFESCLNLGAAAGALCVTGPGGTGSLKSFGVLARYAAGRLGRGLRTAEARKCAIS